MLLYRTNNWIERLHRSLRLLGAMGSILENPRKWGNVGPSALPCWPRAWELCRSAPCWHCLQKQLPSAFLHLDKNNNYNKKCWEIAEPEKAVQKECENHLTSQSKHYGRSGQQSQNCNSGLKSKTYMWEYSQKIEKHHMHNYKHIKFHQGNKE